MATFTTNYNLRKPASSDFVTVASDLNANWDIVDTNLKSVADRVTAIEADKPDYDYWLSTSTQSLTSAVVTTVNTGWVRQGADPGYVTQAAGVFTVTKAGLYMLSARTVFTGNTVGIRTTYLHINGTLTFWAQEDSNGSSNVMSPNLSGQVIRLIVGDTIDVRALQNSGGALTLNNSQGGQMFQITRLGD